LNEESELYDIEIINDSDGSVKRSWASWPLSAVPYTAAQQVADWGSAPTTLHAKVYQRSAIVGRGFPAELTELWDGSPRGGGGGLPSLNYTQLPEVALSNTAPTKIEMLQTLVQFEGAAGPVKYNARTGASAITIATPGADTWYYITIEDPMMTGETIGGPPLPTHADTTDVNRGVYGYTYCGAIKATPAGDGTLVEPGGWPPPGGWQG
jgi:hypothetical protein